MYRIRDSKSERLNFIRDLLALMVCYAVLSYSLTFPNITSAQVGQGGKGVSVKLVNQLPSKEKRWALVIGIDGYEDSNISPLRGAANDAKELARALQKYAGFDESQIVLLTTDSPRERQPTRANILRRLSNLKNLVPKDGLLLVSFSGHGIERAGRAFLIPMDATSTEDVDLLEDTAIGVDNMKRQVKATGVQQVLFFLDACRNDPTSSKAETINPLTEAYKRGFSFNVRNREVEAFATLYATSIGARAYEYAEKRQGYFSWAIVEALSGKATNIRGEVTLNSLVKYVEDRVPKQVQIDLGAKVQIPFAIIEGYKADELVLSIGTIGSPPGLSSLASRADNDSARRTGESLFWQEIETRNTIPAYESYLSAYPNGEFEKLAKLRLGNLNWSNFKGMARNLLKYSQVIYFRDGLAYAALEDYDNGYAQFIDKTGKVVLSRVSRSIGSFYEGFAYIERDGKYGFIDKTGKEIIPPKYEFYEAFSEGLAAVKLNDKWGFIDKTGKEIVPFKYDWVNSFSEGLAAVKVNYKGGFIDKTGKEVIPLKYDRVGSFSEGLAEVVIDDKVGFIDKTGKEVVPLKYDWTTGFSEGLAGVSLNGKLGCIDKSGKEVIPLSFPNEDWLSVPMYFSEGLATITIDKKVGFIDKKGEIVIPPKYDFAYNFRGGLSKVELNGKWGFIDKTGKESIRIKYDGEPWCWEFIEGFIGVKLNGKKGFVDIYGNEYFDFQ